MARASIGSLTRIGVASPFRRSSSSARPIRLDERPTGTIRHHQAGRHTEARGHESTLRRRRTYRAATFDHQQVAALAESRPRRRLVTASGQADRDRGQGVW